MQSRTKQNKAEQSRAKPETKNKNNRDKKR